MKKYNNEISLSKNGRGIWDLDTVKGCSYGMSENQRGCYGDCYSYRIANRYGIDFSYSVKRVFKNNAHREKIIKDIEKIDMPFIRIGCAGDPSENWEHTIKVIKAIRDNSQLSFFDVSSKKQIVIITKHWENLTDNQLKELSSFNICVNTSISALDRPHLLKNGLKQYDRLKEYCKSVLRIVSADFNRDNQKGRYYYKIQNELFKNDKIIDTVFRPTKNNKLVVNGIINTERKVFNKKKSLLSKYNKNTYTGKCNNCKEMCGMYK